MRTAYDFSPLYRSMIGVDHMADLIQSAMRSNGERNYPPYDVEKTADDAYRITIAVAGFKSEELDLVAQPNLLTVAGHKSDDEARTYLHQGIGGRDFQLRFELADYVVVKSATHADGLLTIDLVREVPEALKPRRIEIAGATGGEGARQITGKNKAA